MLLKSEWESTKSGIFVQMGVWYNALNLNTNFQNSTSWVLVELYFRIGFRKEMFRFGSLYFVLVHTFQKESCSLLLTYLLTFNSSNLIKYFVQKSQILVNECILCGKILTLILLCFCEQRLIEVSGVRTFLWKNFLKRFMIYLQRIIS